MARILSAPPVQGSLSLRTIRIPIWLALLVALSGCASIAKGITEAFLEHSEAEDTRACHIQGPPFKGLEALMQEPDADSANGGSARTMKILMVHGIGRHLPGYSGRLQEQLMRALKLDVVDERIKEIKLRSPAVKDGPMGSLRIHRYTDKERTRRLLFYELTWSEITEVEKKAIAFDDSGEWAFRRTGLNNAMKGFLNSHISDPLIYLGRSRLPILASVRQSFCWMTYGDWGDYADHAEEACNFFDEGRLEQMREDNYALIAHSLGSRIVVDTLQYVASIVAENPEFSTLRGEFRDREFPVFMLANQLPLLELGRDPAEVTGEIDAYCRPDGQQRENRLLGRTSIYAFSDPNDILSYGIPPKFVDEYLDSRVCPKVTNIILNISHLISLLGLSEIADPAEAHVGYDHDARVIAMIARGFGHENAAQIIKERCTWLETTED